jgi:hypothetical protein
MMNKIMAQAGRTFLPGRWKGPKEDFDDSIQTNAGSDKRASRRRALWD